MKNTFSKHNKNLFSLHNHLFFSLPGWRYPFFEYEKFRTREKRWKETKKGGWRKRDRALRLARSCNTYEWGEQRWENRAKRGTVWESNVFLINQILIEFSKVAAVHFFHKFHVQCWWHHIHTFFMETSNCSAVCKMWSFTINMSASKYIIKCFLALSLSPAFMWMWLWVL